MQHQQGDIGHSERSLISNARPRLLDSVREAMRARHYSRRTEEAYVMWIKRYCFFHRLRHPAEMADGEINAFLTHLARKYPNAATDWNWQWVFPQEGLWKNERTGEQGRHHADESILQKAVKSPIDTL